MDDGLDRDARFVPVAEFPHRHEADLVCAMLESEGVPAAVRGDGAGGIYPDLASSVGTAVLVPERDLAHAREILRTAIESPDPDPGTTWEGARTGPTRGRRRGDRTGSPSPVIWLTAAILLLLVVGLALTGSPLF